MNEVLLETLSHYLPLSPIRPDPKQVHLGSVVSRYLKNFLSPHTRSAYQNDFQAFGSFLQQNGFEPRHPRDITADHVIAFREHLREHFAPTTVNRKLSALSSLFKELQNARAIEINPAEGVKRPQSITKKERLGFSDAEVVKILDCYSEDSLQGLQHQTLLMMLFFTGCRISEVLSLKVKDLEWKASLSIVHIRGKGDKLRSLPLHPRLSKLLHTLVERRTKTFDDFLFTSVRHDFKTPLKREVVHRLMKRTLKRVKLSADRSLHSTRRTVISNLLESKARIESVAALAGHSNINTTLRYNVRKESLEENPLLTLNYE